MKVHLIFKEEPVSPWERQYIQLTLTWAADKRWSIHSGKGGYRDLVLLPWCPSMALLLAPAPTTFSPKGTPTESYSTWQSLLLNEIPSDCLKPTNSCVHWTHGNLIHPCPTKWWQCSHQLCPISLFLTLWAATVSLCPYISRHESLGSCITNPRVNYQGISVS